MFMFKQMYRINIFVLMPVKDYYTLLKIEPNADLATIKKAYRKLMSQHHPDKLMAQGVPAEMLELAKRRTQDIQAAYELIKQRRSRS